MIPRGGGDNTTMSLPKLDEHLPRREVHAVPQGSCGQAARGTTVMVSCLSEGTIFDTQGACETGEAMELS